MGDMTRELIQALCSWVPAASRAGGLSLFSPFVGLALAIVGCDGGGDTSTLRTQVAELQTRVSRPTPTEVVTATPPDRVVGVSWQCEIFSLEGGGKASEAQGDVCKQLLNPTWCGRSQPVVPGCVYVQKVVVSVVVRTPGGTAYTVNVDNPLAEIPLGSVWPP